MVNIRSAATPWDQTAISRYRKTRVLKRAPAGVEIERIGHLYETKHEEPDLRYRHNPRRYYAKLYGIEVKIDDTMEIEFEFSDRERASTLGEFLHSLADEHKRYLEFHAAQINDFMTDAERA